jgi:hypothetical protein
MADTRTRRPDLEALPVAQRPGFITDKIFPIQPKAMRQGTLYYQDIQSDVVAQTGRTGGVAPTENGVTDAKTTFNLENDEFIDREKIPDAEVAGLGGLDSAQQTAARIGKRAVGNAIEDLTAANILGNVSVTYTDIGSSFVGAVADGFDVVTDYAGDGQVGLVLSSTLFNLVKRYTDVIDRMKYTGVIPASANIVRNLSAEQLAIALGVDFVLIGNRRQWYSQSATYQTRGAIVKIPMPGSTPMPNEDVQVGRTLWFSPNGGEPQENELYECHSWYSEDKLSEMVDTRAYAEQHVLNVELIYGLAGIDAALTS